MPVPHCLDYCSFVIVFKSGSKSPPTLFFFKTVSAIWVPLRFHMNFRIGFLSISTKKCHWNFDRDCTASVDHNNMKSSSLWTRDDFPLTGLL